MYSEVAFKSNTKSNNLAFELNLELESCQLVCRVYTKLQIDLRGCCSNPLSYDTYLSDCYEAVLYLKREDLQR